MSRQWCAALLPVLVGALWCVVLGVVVVRGWA